MLDPKESRFWQSTILSGLMDAQGLTACWNAIPPAKRDDPRHIDRRLARQAVQAKALTLWQAQQIITGRTSGFKVDRYLLLDLIGQGGMGRVYLARDTRLNREVALKILSPERVNNPRAIARFQREARVGAQLQHENLVRIYDFGESSGRYFLVMEYIEGKTIGTLIAEHGRLAPLLAMKLIRQVAMGLEHAHRKGLIHRDVNPYNILVTSDGIAKLADLGLALDLAEDDKVTREGATVGTFDYVAPEQARQSHSADIRSDIYSLGCSLYHMCSGQVPFPTPSLPEKLFAHQAMEAVPLSQLVPGLPVGLSEVVERMMRKAPEERYAAPIEVAQALEPFESEYAAPTGGNGREHVTPEAGVVSREAAVAQTDGGVKKPGAEALAVAKPVEVKTVPDPGIVDGQRSGTRVPSTVRSPTSAEGSDPEFSIDVNIMPEPLLTQGMSRPKTSSVTSYLKAQGVVLARLRQYWLWGLLSVTFAMLIIVVVLAVVNPSVNTLTVAKTDRSPKPEDKNLGPSGSSETTNKTPGGDVQVPGMTSPIVVRSDDGIEQEFPAEKLLDAMKTVQGGRGWVELRNPKPLKFISTSTTPLDLDSGRGVIIIRAAPELEPVIEVELKGVKPLFSMGSAVTLKLYGVTILAHYPQAVAPNSGIPPPVISVAGLSRFERCAFKVASGSRPAGSRAVYSNMGSLEVDRCWFEGFDQAIDVGATSTTHVEISQTMIVPARRHNAAPGQGSEWYGWGVRIQFAGAEGPKTNIRFDHCTVEGAGLIDMTASPGRGRMRVEVRQSAVRAETLLALNAKRPRTEQQIYWRGEANQYDIHGHSWLVNSASAGTPMLSAGAMDLKDWQVFAPDDKNPILSKLKYQKDPAARPESLRPHDFAIEAPGPSQSHSGANPDQVGPWSHP